MSEIELNHGLRQKLVDLWKHKTFNSWETKIFLLGALHATRESKEMQDELNMLYSITEGVWASA